jgi:hypothetical protein
MDDKEVDAQLPLGQQQNLSTIVHDHTPHDVPSMNWICLTPERNQVSWELHRGVQ